MSSDSNEFGIKNRELASILKEAERDGGSYVLVDGEVYWVVDGQVDATGDVLLEVDDPQPEQDVDAT